MIKRYMLALMGMAILIGIISISRVSADTSATIDFEGLPEGSFISTLSCGAGIDCSAGNLAGSVSVFGHNPAINSGNTNVAITFNAECDPDIPKNCTGGEDDLSFPGHGKIFIINENLNPLNPDDADVIGSFFEFDFSAFGPEGVTVNSIDAGDIETEEDEGGAFVAATDGPCVGIETGLDAIPLPFTGNNVMQTVDLQLAGVHCLHVHLNGSGTIDNINFTVVDQAEPAIDIEKWTRIVAAPAGDDVCQTLGKPKTFTLRYTGDNVLDHHQKADKVKVKGTLNGESPVRITAKKHFDGTVNLGETFDTEKGEVIIRDLNGQVLKKIEFHTSCSQPLVLGDQFGGVQLVGYTSKDGQSATFDPTPDDGYGEDADVATGPSGQVGDPVIWTYFVTNTGDAPLHNVIVVDDNGTPADTSDDFGPDYLSGDDNGDDLLDLTEIWLYQATGTVKAGQYQNIGRVSGEDNNGTEVTDLDPSHHVGVLPTGDVCQGKGKLSTLTMLYTGDNVLDHTQASGKVNVSGDPGFASPVHITAGAYFDGTVNLGATFIIDGSALKLGSNTNVLIKDQTGNLLQEIDFHTSCSQPLELGDQFGAIQLIDSTSTG